MKSRSYLICCGLLATAPVACKAKTYSSIVLEIQTDMQMPKDVAVIDVVVTSKTNNHTEGITLRNLQHEFDDPEGIRIPGTFVLETTNNKPEPVHIRVTAYADEAMQRPLVLAEKDTTILPDRILRLPLPLDFLCSDSAVLVDGGTDGAVEYADEKCRAKGFTCSAGGCELAAIDTNDLTVYDPVTDELGINGVKCFDTADCFAGPTDLDLLDGGVGSDSGVNCPNGHCPCVAEVKDGGAFTGDVNIGLRTLGPGMCNGDGCFVALNLGIKAGWRFLAPNDKRRVVLPPAVCTKVANGKIGGVVWRSAGPIPCEVKVETLPTCGPWSPTGSEYANTDPALPVAIVSGQLNPKSLVVTKDYIYWITQGKLGDPLGSGTANWIPKTGGVPIELASQQQIPSALGVLEADVGQRHDFVLWANQGSLTNATGSLRWAAFDRTTYTPRMWTPAESELLANLGSPRGLAVNPNAVDTNTIDIAYTEEQVSRVSVVNATLDVGTGLLTKSPPAPIPIGSPATTSLPYAIAVAQGTKCWTYRDDLGKGGIACDDGGSGASLTLEAGTEQDITPRNLVIVYDSLDSDGGKTRAFWLTSNDGGAVRAASKFSGLGWDPAAQVASIATPTGLAVDIPARRLYIASAKTGSVMWVDLDHIDMGTPMLTALEPNITGRPNLGAIAVDDEYIYWIQQGDPGTATGAILKRKIKP